MPSSARWEGRAAGPVRNSWEGREGESLCDSDNPSKTPEIVIHPCFFFIHAIPKSVPVSFVPVLVKFTYRAIKPRTEGSDSQGGSLRSAILQRESARRHQGGEEETVSLPYPFTARQPPGYCHGAGGGREGVGLRAPVPRRLTLHGEV